MHTTIVQDGDPVLRQRAEEVDVMAILEPATQQLIQQMHTVLATQPDGVALAAPQIGASVRIFVVSPNAFMGHMQPDEHLVYINPKIIKTSQKKIPLDEGCLSVRGIYGVTHRYERATVTALDEYGQSFTRGASGLLAQIFQHEIDHLDGILFIDHAHQLQKQK